MSSEKPFTPRLGHIKDGGQAGSKRFSKQIAKRAAKLAQTSGPKGRVRASFVRGATASAVSSVRHTSYPFSRMRRAVVKVHIARAGYVGGAKAFGEHISYIERDGVDRDGNKGQSYDRDHDQIYTKDFKERSAEDKRQFRLIVSAEDATQIPDLKVEIRGFMSGMEKDLKTKLDWIAVDHFDTGQPHSHVIIRGVDELGDPLAIDRRYLMTGMRTRLSSQLTDSLGLRRDIEILRSQTKDINSDRLTRLDRDLDNLASDQDVLPTKAISEGERFKQSFLRKRLTHLQNLGLAHQQKDKWTFKIGWQDTLKQMGRRGDLIRSINDKYKNLDISNKFKIYDRAKPPSHGLVGRVLGSIPLDELKDTHALLIEGIDGQTWSVDIGSTSKDKLPTKGHTVSVSHQDGKTKSSDQTIARIASLNNGLWSDSIHAVNDPASSPQYRQALKRRLEALRRHKIVSRNKDGSWKVGQDYLAKVQAYETASLEALKIETKSHFKVDKLVQVQALTWIDEIDPRQCANTGFGGQAKQAILARRLWLKEQGLMQAEQNSLSHQARTNLKAKEISSLANMETLNSARTFVSIEQTKSFNGKLERIVDAHQGKLALIGRDNSFTFVPLRSDMGNSLGRDISLTRRGPSIDWKIGRQKGISR
ncbi:relaxase/mobilization nuclease domain-containing protein [Hirschia baltica]|uniref:Conjugal transfer protein TraI n=1 Tax=Hirschia baltica (strain ATCC 49814 / DSM 5838 / IFAM 1418) TaxID=582402 RepID=C6XP93_HIRBI|nr:DUF3363 domain-containing protein [Hirschia baltica]ACT58379.1 conserved hypothetical protein [Hirschia baltica ATCC 49814]